MNNKLEYNIYHVYKADFYKITGELQPIFLLIMIQK